MANGVTKLGNGWGQAPDGTPESLLGSILTAGVLEGEDVCTALKNAGYGNRGPAYYPRENDKGPFYALGEPHDYAAIDVVDGVPQWDLIGFDPSQVKPQQPPAPSPAPSPASGDAALAAALQAAVESTVKGAIADLAAQLGARFDALAAQNDANTEKIQRQIDQAVKNGEATVKALVPIVEAALPALGGLLGRL